MSPLRFDYPESRGTIDMPWAHLEPALRARLLGADLDEEAGTYTVHTMAARPVVSLLLPRVALSAPQVAFGGVDERIRVDWTLLCDPNLLVIGDPT